jgi:hypothetical protein
MPVKSFKDQQSRYCYSISAAKFCKPILKYCFYSKLHVIIVNGFINKELTTHLSL